MEAGVSKSAPVATGEKGWYRGKAFRPLSIVLAIPKRWKAFLFLLTLIQKRRGKLQCNKCGAIMVEAKGPGWGSDIILRCPACPLADESGVGFGITSIKNQQIIKKGE
ncbi:MAG: hypothetical protein ABH830_03335 [Patescibacteria group bacterium]